MERWQKYLLKFLPRFDSFEADYNRKASVQISPQIQTKPAKNHCIIG